jgi:alanyl-tRNA synthetase
VKETVTSNEIRNSFLKFFEGKGHTTVPSAPVIPYDDPTLLFTNAGMNQFKDVFLGTGKRDYTRVANSQKCIRVSGKHNDLEEVGRDTYHHTFFEMLGNWSFGDYYKKEAISWAWELLTEVWKLPKGRLWATVYKTDDEAEECWKKCMDINPSHVLQFGEKDNFWEMGETGPCGPCSEIHIDLSEKGDIDSSFINAGRPEAIEIWNLVFIQYNRDEKGELEPLPAKHVDTGMGFERVVAILQGKKSNYDTDLFQPTIRTLEGLTGKHYDGRILARQSAIGNPQSEIDVSFRVIADHVRALTFAIADGAIPSNEGRGYVLRRILRRASRFGRSLDMHEPFIYKLVLPLVETMGDAYPEIRQKQSFVEQAIKGEEEGFNQTLDRGLEIFESVVTRIGHSKVFPGEDAFKLYDTYGFPLDLTELMAEEKGLKVDVTTFTELMEKQRDRSRGSSLINEYGFQEIREKYDDAYNETEFLGYERFEVQTPIAVFGSSLWGVNKVEIPDQSQVVLFRTPFYAEAGGQVGDTGRIVGEDFEFIVRDTQKRNRDVVHIGLLSRGDIREFSERDFVVLASVDKPRRLNIMKNHTATHLVHEALRRVLGTHLHQQGSLVAPDRLRFDFNHFQKISPDEIREIENIVNEKITEAITVNALNDPNDWVTIEEAKRRYPNIKMFFGEKYGDRVRVVEIPKFCAELCGGTHVKNTREIGLFKIISESSIASGIRRIEAVTGEGATLFAQSQEQNLLERINYALNVIEELESLQQDLYELSEGHSDAAVEVYHNYESGLENLKRSDTKFLDPRQHFDELSDRRLRVEKIILGLFEKKKMIEKESSRYRVKSLSNDIDKLVKSGVTINGFKVVASEIQVDSDKELNALADTLRSKLGSGVGLLCGVIDKKISFVCVVTDDLIVSRQGHAGKIVDQVARIVGGRGGGNPRRATAGGKDIKKLDEALKSTSAIVKSLLT